MAWEHRKNSRQKYYYRSRRLRDGRVEKTYIGTGPVAEIAASADRAQREEEARLTQQHRVLLADMHRATAQLDSLITYCNTITEAALLASGYHHHRGEWRKRRHGRHYDSI